VTWYAATPLITLRDALNRHWPKRDHRSDGFIGDARHAATKSSHNPDPTSTPPGCVRGGDYDADGINAAWVAEHLRLAGAAGDPRLAHGGYVIFNGRIAGDWTGWQWVHYTGADDHSGHIHVTTAPAGDREDAPWSFLEVAQAAPADPPPHPGRVPAHDATGHDAGFRAEIGDQGPKIEAMQHELNERFPAYSDLEEDGIYGAKTADVLDELAERASHDPATPAGDRKGLHDADGENIGPRLGRALDRYGVV
jgi:hypothetical protein